MKRTHSQMSKDYNERARPEPQKRLQEEEKKVNDSIPLVFDPKRDLNRNNINNSLDMGQSNMRREA